MPVVYLEENAEVQGVLRLLTEKTKAGKLQWDGAEDSYGVGMHFAELIICKSGNEYTVRIYDDLGDKLYNRLIGPNSDEYDLLEELWGAISGEVRSRLDVVLADIRRYLEVL